MKKILSLILVLGVLCTTFCACGTPQRENSLVAASTDFEQLVLDGKYADAIDSYYEEISGDAGKEAQAISFMNEYLDESLSSYAAGTLSAEQVDIVIATLQKINDSLYLITDTLSSANDTYRTLVESKEAYALGVKYMEEEQYLDALLTFSGVSELDSENYTAAESHSVSACDAYYTQTIELVKNDIAVGAYDEAVFLLENAEYYIGYYDEFDVLKIEANTAKAETQITTWLNQGDYSGAFSAYKEDLTLPEISFSPEFLQKMAEWETSYRNDILQQAADAANSNDYGTAFSILDDALLVLENDPDFLVCMQKIEADYEDYLMRSTPVNLTEFEPYLVNQTGDLSVLHNVEDIMGNSYSNALTQGGGKESATWRIDGIYKILEGVFFVRSKNAEISRTVSIVGDGVELYRNIIAGGADPSQFSIDVTNVRDLTITIEGGATWQEVNTYLANPILTP